MNGKFTWSCGEKNSRHTGTMERNNGEMTRIKSTNLRVKAMATI